MNLLKSSLVGLIVIMITIFLLIIFTIVSLLNIKVIRDEINRVPDFLSTSLKGKTYTKTNENFSQTFQIELDDTQASEINNILIENDNSIVLNKNKIYRISINPSVENSESFTYNALFEIKNKKSEVLAEGFHYWGSNNDSFYRDTSKINFILNTKNLDLSERTLGFYMTMNDASPSNISFTMDSKYSNISINEVK